MRTDLLDQIHTFWFGPLAGPLALPEDRIGLWFGSTPAMDAEIGARFGTAITQAAAETWDLHSLSPRQRVGLVVLLDQFPRNVYRGTPEVYASDDKAKIIARQFFDLPRTGLTPIETMFATLPFGHSEQLDDQELALAILLSEILPIAPPHPFWDNARRQAVHYRDIIAQFGRFPHRNAVLGRDSTAEELAFIAETRLAPG